MKVTASIAMSVCVAAVVDKVATVQASSQYIGFSPLSFHQRSKVVH